MATIDKEMNKSSAVWVRMQIPLRLQCNGCRRCTFEGVRYPGLKEKVGMDPTFDVEIYRYQFKCPWCQADFSIKSDPGRYDYVLDAGATLIPK